MRYLLDTNIVSDLVRNPNGKIARRIVDIGNSAICTSVVVAAELRYGARKRNSARLNDQLDAILNAIEIVPIEVPVDLIFGELRARLDCEGRPIGANDLFIAAQAVALKFILVTANVREFSRIAELECENWLQ